MKSTFGLRTLSLRYLPVKYIGMNKAEINFSTIEHHIANFDVMKNIQVYFNMEFYQFANELVNEDAEIIGWEYRSGDKILVVNFDECNCSNFWN